MAVKMRKPNKRVKSGPKVKYETGDYSYGSREWYQSNIGGKTKTRK